MIKVALVGSFETGSHLEETMDVFFAPCGYL